MFAQESKNIITVMDKQMAAWNRGDLEGFMQGYWKSDSLMFVSPSRHTAGRLRLIITSVAIRIRLLWVFYLLILKR